MPEKVFFKMHAFRDKRIKGYTNYVKLFDAIDKQREYDEKKIKTLFDKERFVKHYAVTKHYLYQLILKCLHNYNSDDDTKIYEQLHCALILYHKALYKECYKELLKAKKKCYAREKFEQLLKILDFEHRLKEKTSSNIKELDEIVKEIQDVLEKLKNTYDYLSTSRKIMNVITKYGEKSDQKRNMLYELMSHPLLKNENNCLTFRARNFYYNIHSAYYFSMKDSVNGYRYAKKQLQLAESNSQHIKENAYGYIITISNFLAACHRLKKYNELEHGIEKIKLFGEALPVKNSEHIQVRLFISYINFKLILYIETAKYEKARVLVNDIKSGFIKYGKNIRPESKYIIYSNIAELYFKGGQYRETINWVNKILNTKMEIREDIQSTARIYNLISHYELGNEDKVESLLNSASRFLNKDHDSYQLENRVVDFFRKQLLKRQSKPELKKTFGQFKTEIEKNKKLNSEEKPSYDSDIISWIESKVENRSFAKM